MPKSKTYHIFLTDHAHQAYTNQNVLKTFINKAGLIVCRKIDPTPAFLIAEVLWELKDNEPVYVSVYMSYTDVRAILTSPENDKNLGFLLDEPQRHQPH